jgi:hypothetical protein
LGVKIIFHCLVFHHVLCDYPGSVSGVSDLEVAFGHAFQLLLQLNEVDCRCQLYWGGLLLLLWVAASGGVGSVAGASISISVARRGRRSSWSGLALLELAQLLSLVSSLRSGLSFSAADLLEVVSLVRLSCRAAIF